MIRIGPEPHCLGSGSLVLGVGRRKWRLHCMVCTPPRKIRARFHGYKHTSLKFTYYTDSVEVNDFSEAHLITFNANITHLGDAPGSRCLLR
jgi:hypothetical protein